MGRTGELRVRGPNGTSSTSACASHPRLSHRRSPGRTGPRRRARRSPRFILAARRRTRNRTDRAARNRTSAAGCRGVGGRPRGRGSRGLSVGNQRSARSQTRWFRGGRRSRSRRATRGGRASARGFAAVPPAGLPGALRPILEAARASGPRRRSSRAGSGGRAARAKPFAATAGPVRRGGNAASSRGGAEVGDRDDERVTRKAAVRPRATRPGGRRRTSRAGSRARGARCGRPRSSGFICSRPSRSRTSMIELARGSARPAPRTASCLASGRLSAMGDTPPIIAASCGCDGRSGDLSIPRPRWAGTRRTGVPALSRLPPTTCSS